MDRYYRTPLCNNERALWWIVDAIGYGVYFLQPVLDVMSFKLPTVCYPRIIADVMRWLESYWKIRLEEQPLDD